MLGISVFLLLCVGMMVTVTLGKWTFDIIQERFVSSQTHIEETFDGLEKPVFINGKQLEHSAVGQGEDLMLSLETIKQWIDPSIYWEEETESVIVTTDDQVIHFRSDQLTAMVNDQPITLSFPVRKIDEIIYVPISPLASLYGIDIRESDETGAVMIWKPGDVIQWGKIIDPDGLQWAKLRTEASIKAPYTKRLQHDEDVIIFSEPIEGWYFVQLPSGYFGYIEKRKVKLASLEQVPRLVKEQTFIPWKPLGGKINLTWEAVYNVPADPAKIGEMPGLNVISPTWFELRKNEAGEFYVYNKADPHYVNWAHNRGYQVWVLFSNSFDPDWTTEMLSNVDSRMAIIRQLVSLANLYNIQGINIDFENVYLEDKDKFTQFVRELTPFLHEQGLVVSIDVTIRGGSPMWSLFLDREELGKVVDYMIVMTYDEHWASSPVAGSVASLPWVEKGIVDIMREDHVPASKLLLGVPYYTRIWTEKTENGSVSVSSRAVSMNAVQQVIEKYGLTPVYDEKTGQHYVEYIEDGNTNKIWIEDAMSMRRRAELVVKHQLAGIASWRRGFESQDIWDVIVDVFDQQLVED